MDSREGAQTPAERLGPYAFWQTKHARWKRKRWRWRIVLHSAEAFERAPSVTKSSGGGSPPAG